MTYRPTFKDIAWNTRRVIATHPFSVAVCSFYKLASMILFLTGTLIIIVFLTGALISEVAAPATDGEITGKLGRLSAFLPGWLMDSFVFLLNPAHLWWMLATLIGLFGGSFILDYLFARRSARVGTVDELHYSHVLLEDLKSGAFEHTFADKNTNQKINHWKYLFYKARALARCSRIVVQFIPNIVVVMMLFALALWLDPWLTAILTAGFVLIIPVQWVTLKWVRKNEEAFHAARDEASAIRDNIAREHFAGNREDSLYNVDGTVIEDGAFLYFNREVIVAKSSALYRAMSFVVIILAVVFVLRAGLIQLNSIQLGLVYLVIMQRSFNTLTSVSTSVSTMFRFILQMPELVDYIRHKALSKGRTTI